MARIGVADARYMGLRWPRDAGGKTVNRLLDWLGGAAVTWRWVVIVGWLIILGGLLGARHEFGGTYVNDYTVPGTGSANGLNRLNSTFPQEGGFGVPSPGHS